MAADDLAFLAHRLDRRSYLHDPFRRLGSGDSALAAVAAAATGSRTCPAQAKPPGTWAGLQMVATSAGARYLLCDRLTQTRVGGKVPGGENLGSSGGDCDGELEVRGGRAVLGIDRPTVPADAHAGASGGGHRLDGEHHALLQ